jgi:glycosyltransferase involved in cell wall biosynthesis
MMNNRPHENPSIEVSVVLPAHNEEGNILPLMEQFGELSRKARFSFDVILVDDGSTDQTLPRAVEAQRQHRFLRIVSVPHRRGLTEALRAGFAAARGQIIVFYPSDRQFHPADIPRMVEKVRSGYDLVTGRKIGVYNKKFVSSFYNRLSRWLFPSILVSDLNSVKAFRRELIDVFDYRHDWHRFWVAIAAEAGYRIGEVDVTLYQRGSGRSKFGFWRIPGGVLDLLAVKFQYHTMRRPLWYFGSTGLILLLASFIVGCIELYQRFVLGHGYRPMLYLIMSLGLSGVVFFAMGFLAEAVAGVRQQLETLRPAPRYQVHRPGPTDRPAPRYPSPPIESSRSERPQGDSSDRHDRRPPRREGRPGGLPRTPRPAPPRETHVAPEPTPPEVIESSREVAPPVPTHEEPAPLRQESHDDDLFRADRVVDSPAPVAAPEAPPPTPVNPTPKPAMYGRRKRS